MNESDGILRSIQQIESSILGEFAAICEKYGLTYYLYGGTLIGAVRHKGFVPWDDDIDVAMPREDYEKFLEIAQNELPSHLFLQHYSTDKGYYLLFAKIRDNNTTFIEDGTSHLIMHKGIYIDIFPLDIVPDQLFLQGLEVFLLRTLCRVYSVKKFYYGSGLSTFQKLKLFLIKLLPLKCDYIIHIFEKVLEINRRKGGGYLGDLHLSPNRMRIYKKTLFDRTMKFEFEGRLYDGPVGYHEYLKQYFGDYMQLPPVEKRKPTHSELCDPYKPFNKQF